MSSLLLSLFSRLCCSFFLSFFLFLRPDFFRQRRKGYAFRNILHKYNQWIMHTNGNSSRFMKKENVNLNQFLRFFYSLRTDPVQTAKISLLFFILGRQRYSFFSQNFALSIFGWRTGKVGKNASRYLFLISEFWVQIQLKLMLPFAILRFINIPQSGLADWQNIKASDEMFCNTCFDSACSEFKSRFISSE